MAGELFEQLQVGETEATDFNLAKHLMGPGLENRFGFIDAELVGTYQLHRTLFFRNSCHGTHKLGTKPQNFNSLYVKLWGQTSDLQLAHKSFDANFSSVKPPAVTALTISIAAICATAIAEVTNTVPQTKQIPAALGWHVAHDKELNGIEINQSELSHFIEGFRLGAQDRRLPFNIQEISPGVDVLAKQRQAPVIDAIRRQSALEAEQFLAAWKSRAKVAELPDGVCYEILQHGTGEFPKPAQTVKVHYIAHLVNGSQISEFGPDNIILVTNHLNTGLFEGFQKLDRGGKMKLYLPPALASDEIEIAGQPHGSALVYEIEMSAIKDTPTNELADALVPPAPETAPPGYSGHFPSNDVIETWGWEIAQRARLWKLTLTDDEMASMARGFEMGVRNQPFPDFVRLEPQVEQFVSERKQQYQQALHNKQIAAMNSFFADLNKNTNVVKLSDGLRYEVLKTGNGPYPQRGQTVIVNYTARTLDGHIFDQTLNEPLHVEIGRVIPGWNEGIQKINKGGRIKLYIPPSLGYGSDAVSGVPADSTLIYDIELLDIN